MNHIILYFLIFFSKVIENALSTLRLIVVSNGKKVIGAILQFTVTIVWILVTGIVIIDVTTDPVKIIFFSLGSLTGSYVGSVIEEKISLGNCLLICYVNKKISKLIIDELEFNKYDITSINSNNYTILFIIIKRKLRRNIKNIVKKYDKNSSIVPLNIK